MLLLLFTMRTSWIWIVKEILTCVNWLRSTHCRKFLLVTMQTRLLRSYYFSITSHWPWVVTGLSYVIKRNDTNNDIIFFYVWWHAGNLLQHFTNSIWARITQPTWLSRINFTLELHIDKLFFYLMFWACTAVHMLKNKIKDRYNNNDYLSLLFFYFCFVEEYVTLIFIG